MKASKLAFTLLDSERAFADFSFASLAFVNNPFSPVNIDILIPARIKSTIIVITNAINVIPFV